MVEIGSVISAQVVRVEPYGVWLDYQGENVLVLITDLSWQPVRNPADFARVGQTMDVKVVLYNYRDRVIRASLKATDQESNPYRRLSRLEPGKVLQGKVAFLDADQITVNLADNVVGYLPRARVSTDVNLGEVLPVVIAALDVEEGRLNLNVAAGTNDTPLQHEHHLATAS